MYLDQHYTKQYNIENLLTKSMSLFKQHVFWTLDNENRPLQGWLINSFATAITQWRSGMSVDEMNLVEVAQIFKQMKDKDEDESKTDLFARLVSDTSEYYS